MPPYFRLSIPGFPKGGKMRSRRWLVVALLQLGAMGLVSGQAAFAADGAEPAYFLVKVHDEVFVVAITDEEAIAEAEASLAGRKDMFPIGRVAMGDGGFNSGYHWHLVPESVRMTEYAIELCDGLPSHVERNPEGWAASARFFCPWSGKITKRLTGPGQADSPES